MIANGYESPLNFFEVTLAHTARSSAAREGSGVVALGKQAEPACRAPPHHFPREVLKAPRRVRATAGKFGMIHRSAAGAEAYENYVGTIWNGS